MMARRVRPRKNQQLTPTIFGLGEPHSLEALLNHEEGLIGRWLQFPEVRRNARYEWQYLIETGHIIFPRIVEDRNETTCIRIPLGFVKAIMVVLGAPPGTVVHVGHWDHGHHEEAAVRIDENVPGNAAAAALKELEINMNQDHDFFYNIESSWHVFILAFLQFARRGCRRLLPGHLKTIVNTAFVCQVQEWAQQTPREMEFARKQMYTKIPSTALKSVPFAEALPFLKELEDFNKGSKDEYSIGIFHSFEIGFVPKLSTFYRASLATLLHGENLAFSCAKYPKLLTYYSQVLKLFYSKYSLLH